MANEINLTFILLSPIVIGMTIIITMIISNIIAKKENKIWNVELAYIEKSISNAQYKTFLEHAMNYGKCKQFTDILFNQIVISENLKPCDIIGCKEAKFNKNCRNCKYKDKCNH